MRRGLTVIDVCFKLVHFAAQVPHKNEYDMGYDFSVVPDEDFNGVRYVLEPGKSHLFHLGIATAIEPGYGCLLWDRSSLGAIDCIHRFAGVIDSGYRGEWKVRLHNFGPDSRVITVGDRIIQGIFTEMINVDWKECDELPQSLRGTGGFGSTGK